MKILIILYLFAQRETIQKNTNGACYDTFQYFGKYHKAETQNTKHKTQNNKHDYSNINGSVTIFEILF